MPAGYRLRPITPADEPLLERIYASTRQEELAVVPWSAEQKAAFLKGQFLAQHTHYLRCYADAQFSIVHEPESALPLGRLYLHRSLAELRIVDISLLPEHRGQGLGSRILEDVLAEAEGSGRKVGIHVERNNRARRLYERLGFQFQADAGPYLFLSWTPAKVS